MPVEWFEALERVLRRLKSIAESDPSLQEEMRSLVRATLAWAGEKPPPVVAEKAEKEPIPAAAAAPPVESPPPPPAPVPAARPPLTRPLAHLVSPPADAPRVELPPLTLGQSRNGAAATGSSFAETRTTAPRSWAPITDDDLPLIERRCRLKAEGTRWAVERQRILREGGDARADVEPRDRDIIDRAKGLPDCFLWMNYQGGPAPDDPALMENLAGCFTTLGDAVRMLAEIVAEQDVPRHTFEQALELTAESQSALRAAVNQVGVNTDSDQQKVFTWLKNTTGREAIYIRRHMRVDDPADPRHWADIAARVEAFRGEWQQGRQRDRQHQSRLKKVQYHVKRIAQGEGAEYDWQKVVETSEEMIQDGLPPSNRELREMLLPVIEQAPDLGEPPPGFRLVLREIDRFIANRPATAADEEDAASERSAEVREAARLLNGTAAVLIGGEPRGYAKQSLERALGLSELIWAESREHQSLAFFEPIVARPDVSLVLLAIRWSSHSFGEVKQFCDHYGKLLVRLPGGYSPNQVAAQVLSQCSSRLNVK